MRRVMRALSTVLIAAGLALIIDAGVTLVWQEPVSAFFAMLDQHDLSGRLNRIEMTPATPIEVKALKHLGNERQRIAFLARQQRRRAKQGDPIGRIKIKKIGANYVVVQGTDTQSLMKGPGHYPNTPFPGLPGTVAIAGHRTTYLAPFHDINELHHGDKIELQMPYANFTYSVQRVQIVDPDALWVLQRKRYDRLVLSACHPLYSASHRIIVFARLTRTQPRGLALRNSVGSGP
jgi:sortase A